MKTDKHYFMKMVDKYKLNVVYMPINSFENPNKLHGIIAIGFMLNKIAN